MSYSRISSNLSSLASDICGDPKVVSTVNAIVPEAVGLAATVASGGNPVAKASAKAATQVAIRNAPNAVAEGAVAVATGVLLDLATPVFIVGAAAVGVGYVAKKGLDAVGDMIDELFG